MIFAPFICPYLIMYTTLRLSLKCMEYLVDMSSNLLKMYLMYVSQYQYEKWLLPQWGMQYKKLGIHFLKYKISP